MNETISLEQKQLLLVNSSKWLLLSTFLSTTFNVLTFNVFRVLYLTFGKAEEIKMIESKQVNQDSIGIQTDINGAEAQKTLKRTKKKLTVAFRTDELQKQLREKEAENAKLKAKVLTLQNSLEEANTSQMNVLQLTSTSIQSNNEPDISPDTAELEVKLRELQEEIEVWRKASEIDKQAAADESRIQLELVIQEKDCLNKENQRLKDELENKIFVVQSVEVQTEAQDVLLHETTSEGGNKKVVLLRKKAANLRKKLEDLRQNNIDLRKKVKTLEQNANPPVFDQENWDTNIPPHVVLTEDMKRMLERNR